MTRKKFVLPDFDACSVALFATLVFMGPLPPRTAQPTAARAAMVSTRLPDGLHARGEAADRREDDSRTESKRPRR